MRRLLSSFSLALCLLFSLSFAIRIATIYASRLLQLHIFTLPYLLSLNSLDREGARLLSPCGSQITITPDAGPDDSTPGDAYYISSGAQLGVIGTVSHVGLSFILAP